MWLKWLPWKLTVRRLAQSHGFLDPIALLSLVRRFSQPAEVAEPIELLRAGVVLHARGLINARAIQHNLDWIWPLWVERQFDPADVAFVPRAFSLTHINLTHRNWTAIGIPGHEELPIVDPAGLVTPFLDGWSIDGWMISETGAVLAPSRLQGFHQQIDFTDGLRVTTENTEGECWLRSEAEVVSTPDGPACTIRLSGQSPSPAWLCFSLRPCNPEGISFIHTIAIDSERRHWTVDGQRTIAFDAPIERHRFSEYHAGDVALQVLDGHDSDKVTCGVGMATAAALFALPTGERREIGLSIPLHRPHAHSNNSTNKSTAAEVWKNALDGLCAFRSDYKQFQFLYDAAIRTVLLHTPGDVYAGPYTYKRFWFRDAVFILNAMLRTGMIAKSESIIDNFERRLTPFGFFHSQEGEWDSNGQVLWIKAEFCRLTGRPPKDKWLGPIRRGAHWIMTKRRSVFRAKAHPGLFPAGFSAEHLGPIDFYYWDDFWGVAGLRAATWMLRQVNDEVSAARCEADAIEFMNDIDRSLSEAARRLGRPAMPAAPERRLDAGAIGSLAAGYPAQLVDAHDARLIDTVDYMMDNCIVMGGFFQDMIHSGVNAYLSLHLAQVLLRASDARYQGLIEAVAEMASPTGQWPEAVHPHTRGGCMGDGQHVWAASEWIVMIRNCFVLEEFASDRLILGAGLFPDWLAGAGEMQFGPTPTAWGAVTIRVTPQSAPDGAPDGAPNGDAIRIEWYAKWHSTPPPIEVRLPGCAPVVPDANATYVLVQRKKSV